MLLLDLFFQLSNNSRTTQINSNCILRLFFNLFSAEMHFCIFHNNLGTGARWTIRWMKFYEQNPVSKFTDVSRFAGFRWRGVIRETLTPGGLGIDKVNCVRWACKLEDFWENWFCHTMLSGWVEVRGGPLYAWITWIMYLFIYSELEKDSLENSIRGQCCWWVEKITKNTKTRGISINLNFLQK